MKKIGLWMAALTAVTVGGVYATFNYTDSTQMNTSMSDTAISLADAKLEGAAGVLSVDADDLLIKIDSAKTILGANIGTTNPHKAMIQASGSVVVRFTPNEGLQEMDILNNGIHAKISFKASWGGVADWKYDSNGDDTADMQVFSSMNTSELEIHQMDETDAIYRWTKDGNSFTFTITAEQLFGVAEDESTTEIEKIDPILGSALLVMNNDVVLDTHKEYLAFATTFSSKNIEAHVSAAAEDDAKV